MGAFVCDRESVPSRVCENPSGVVDWGEAGEGVVVSERNGCTVRGIKGRVGGSCEVAGEEAVVGSGGGGGGGWGGGAAVDEVVVERREGVGEDREGGEGEGEEEEEEEEGGVVGEEHG